MDTINSHFNDKCVLFYNDNISFKEVLLLKKTIVINDSIDFILHDSKSKGLIESIFKDEIENNKVKLKRVFDYIGMNGSKFIEFLGMYKNVIPFNDVYIKFILDCIFRSKAYHRYKNIICIGMDIKLSDLNILDKFNKDYTILSSEEFYKIYSQVPQNILKAYNNIDYD